MPYAIRVALTVALGGFLMGFDASVISGVVTFIEPEFNLSKIELGWSVASLTLTATLAMMVSGPLSDRLGRRPVLKIAAVLFALSAVASAVAPNFIVLVAARMLGGFGVGAALIIAPMYIAEIAPAAMRGRMVSFNQLNIVIGISAAFFTNYLILRFGQSGLAWAEALHLGEWNWRWMLGVEALPAIFYFLALFAVPESPRWLVMNGRDDDARRVLERVTNSAQAEADIGSVKASLQAEQSTKGAPLRELFRPAMRLVLVIGISVAVLQQVTGINSVFFYAPMIFEQSGIGTDASFMQAVLVGLVNLAFTVLAILFIDRLGRRPLLGAGLTGIAVCMLLLSYGFASATYTLTSDAVAALPPEISRDALQPILERTCDSDVAFRQALVDAVGSETFRNHQSALVSAAIDMNPKIILVGILGFVASFAVSLGPVMWVLFSELFPNQLRGLAISFVGLINSAVSFSVQLIFPWELQNLGNSLTFLIYGLFAIVGLFLLMRLLPETKGKSLEELEAELVGNNTPVFFIRDAIKFPDFVHSQKYDPHSNRQEANNVWDFFSRAPEATHQFVWLFGDRGIPASYRHMNGYGSHTFMWVNASGEKFWVKFHFKVDQGIRCLTSDEAAAIGGADPQYSQKDLYHAIESGDFPSWTLKAQVMPEADAAAYRFNPFDLTKVWPHGDYPLIEVGKLVLDRTPDNYFAEVEQSTFSPANMVPGIGPSPDKMLQARLFAYGDAQRYRAGVNHGQLPVNAPKGVEAKRPMNHGRDGAMCFGDNGGGAPNYEPNGVGGLQQAGGEYELDYPVAGRVGQYTTPTHEDDDDFSQAGGLFRLMNAAEQARLIANLAGSLAQVTRADVRERSIEHFASADRDLGRRLREAVVKARG